MMEKGRRREGVSKGERHITKGKERRIKRKQKKEYTM